MRATIEAHRIHPQPEARVCARPGCEKLFIPDAFNVVKGWGRYCSKTCSATMSRLGRRSRGQTLTCAREGCERTFWRYDHEAARRAARYCSLKHATEDRWAHGAGISPDLVSLRTGTSRQRWYGRWNGKKGAAAGIEAGKAKGGRPQAEGALEALEPFALPLDLFLAATSETPPALLGTGRETILPAGALLVLAGKAGSGKTSASLAAALHLASGVEWLGLSVPRPLRVLLIENEGPREPFRAKLDRFRQAWPHPLTGALFVYSRNWGQLSFADEKMRAELRDFLEAEAIDLVIGDPLGSLGVEGVGSPSDTRAFVDLLRKLGLGRVAFWLLHHFRKEPTADELDELSGDWGKHADTVLVLKRRPGNRARLSFPKLRWALSRQPAILAFEPESELFTFVATTSATLWPSLRSCSLTARRAPRARSRRSATRGASGRSATLLRRHSPRTLTASFHGPAGRSDAARERRAGYLPQPRGKWDK